MELLALSVAFLSLHYATNLLNIQDSLLRDPNDIQLNVIVCVQIKFLHQSSFEVIILLM